MGPGIMDAWRSSSIPQQRYESITTDSSCFSEASTGFPVVVMSLKNRWNLRPGWSRGLWITPEQATNDEP